jgi:GNAT superfamily N-acetyltransferase
VAEPGAQVVVRPARPEDLDALADLLTQLHPAYPPDSGASRRVLAQIFEDPNRTLLVAESRGRVVGTADLLVVANLTHGGSPWVIVENVVVDEGARGRGVGHELMADVLRRARAVGAYMVQLLSLDHRTAAHRFYADLGFAPVARGLRYYLGDFAPTGPAEPG